ncbi:hypothetical protein [Chitinophaga sp. 212800010-3]|uniref:hypothetical protein n=1 Tax=unclassified Chitinophaga TaxID=2619133 RepID=UPI002DF62080|nr:Natural product [Chitinophaga sp. 212800010-3]
MPEKNITLNSRPILKLEKEIISKADTLAIENMRAAGVVEMVHSSVPTTPTTFGSVFIPES